MKYLTTDQVVRLHKVLIETSGGSSGIRDKGTRLAYGLIKNHPFVDGNKRIATHAMLIFLSLNGMMLSYEDEELIDIILKVASSQANESDLYQWIDKHQV